jgi:hypothetical protein
LSPFWSILKYRSSNTTPHIIPVTYKIFRTISLLSPLRSILKYLLTESVEPSISHISPQVYHDVSIIHPLISSQLLTESLDPSVSHLSSEIHHDEVITATGTYRICRTICLSSLP